MSNVKVQRISIFVTNGPVMAMFREPAVIFRLAQKSNRYTAITSSV